MIYYYLYKDQLERKRAENPIMQTLESPPVKNRNRSRKEKQRTIPKMRDIDFNYIEKNKIALRNNYKEEFTSQNPFQKRTQISNIQSRKNFVERRQKMFEVNKTFQTIKKFEKDSGERIPELSFLNQDLNSYSKTNLKSINPNLNVTITEGKDKESVIEEFILFRV